MTSHRCIQRSQRTQLKKHLFGERESEKGRKTMRERELARMCVWDDARDEKCLTPGESDVPERMSWEKWRLADETVVVSSNFINYWVPSDYPVHLSCVTLTLTKTTVMILSFYNIENPFGSYAILEMVPDSSTVLLHSCFAEYKIGIICKSKFKYIPFGPRLTHPENPALKSSWWMLSCQKLNAFVAEKHIWIFIRPRLKSLPCPLDTPDGCNSTFFYFSVNLRVWLMYGHLYAIMNVRENRVKVTLVDWNLEWILILYMFHWLEAVCQSLYICFSSL